MSPSGGGETALLEALWHPAGAIPSPEVDLPALLAQLREHFGRACLPLNLPTNGGHAVVDCFYDADGPATDFSSVSQAHRARVEQVVEVDAAFVERYLEDGDVEPRELHVPLDPCATATSSACGTC